MRPSFCDIEVTCASVTPQNVNLPCQNLDSEGKVSWTFTPEDYTERRIRPGTYRFKYDVAVNQDVVKKSFFVDVTLIDPCAPPQVT